jgi:CheY-like chemotaxis protein
MAKIVFCEDSALIQKIIRAALEPTPHEVHIASDGAEGLALVERVRPDLVFTDVSMPGMDGWEVARRLRRHMEPGKALLAAITAYGREQDRRCSQEAGFDLHLVKPVDSNSLRQLLAAANGGSASDASRLALPGGESGRPPLRPELRRGDATGQLDARQAHWAPEKGQSERRPASAWRH